MPRFYFHVHDDLITIDEDGVELPDLAAVHKQALAGARDLACAELLRGKLSLHHRIEVEDEEGRPVLTLPFRAAFTVED